MPDSFDETDAVLARKLAEIPPPADLRARLLAVEATPVAAVEATTRSWWTQGITALAACLVLALVALSLWPSPGDQLAVATADLSTFLSSGFALTVETPDVQRVRSWLVQNNPGHNIDLPTALAQNPSIFAVSSGGATIAARWRVSTLGTVARRTLRCSPAEHFPTPRGQPPKSRKPARGPARPGRRTE